MEEEIKLEVEKKSRKLNLVSFGKKYWWLIALLLIFLFCFHIRAVNTIEDRLLSFDPILQYRYTRYFVENSGAIPLWDELSYYSGRYAFLSDYPPFMFYITGLLYWIFSFGVTLKTFASYMGAVYGAMIIFPAFLLGRKLSNKYGGLLAAVLIGTAPAILSRTFGASFDTDQIVLFFVILTLYLGFKVLKKPNITNFCLVSMGFVGFMFAWGMFMYTYIILVAFTVFYLIFGILIGDKSWNKESEKSVIKPKLSEKMKLSFNVFKKQIIVLVALLILLILVGFINNINVFKSILDITGFAQKAETWIVNISIAELQMIDILNMYSWITSMGRFIIGNFDIVLLLLFIVLIAFGLMKSYNKNILDTSFLITLLLISMYTVTRGVRFTEFSSALFLILVATGFGYMTKLCWNNKYLKIVTIAIGILIVFIAMNLGLQTGENLRADFNPNWDNAWNFLKDETPKLSLVGTWWDPGHMIAGLAERRNIGDGGHCKEPCLYTINDRITDLGRIMATTNESESLELIRKYQGNSPKVYWIASVDLVQKFRWIEYFGMGCDGTGIYTPDGPMKCPLYLMLGQVNIIHTPEGMGAGTIYSNGYVNVTVLFGTMPIAFVTEGMNAAFFEETIFYRDIGTAEIYRMNDLDQETFEMTKKTIEQQLGLRFSNTTVPSALWIARDFTRVVIIPPNMKNNVFTRMFFLEGQGLEHFKQVFRNEEVKIYEVV